MNLCWKQCLNDPCQDDSNYKELSYEEAEPSSPQCSTNQSRKKEVHYFNSIGDKDISKCMQCFNIKIFYAVCIII
jgi:hypothetical protein